MTDSYPDGINLKGMTQHWKGIGMHVEFDSNTPFPIDFARSFLRRSEYKCKFYPFPVELILQKYQFYDKIIVVAARG